MDEDRHGLFPSDHLAIFALIDFDLDPPELLGAVEPDRGSDVPADGR